MARIDQGRNLGPSRDDTWVCMQGRHYVIRKLLLIAKRSTHDFRGVVPETLEAVRKHKHVATLFFSE